MAASAVETADRFRESARYFPVGDPHRLLLIDGSDIIAELLTRSSTYTAEGVDHWLREQGVVLTIRMRRQLGLDRVEV
jgi:hypothetical protein